MSNSAPSLGRLPASNIFRATPGIINNVIRASIKSPYDAWKCIVDERMLRHVHHCTMKHAESENDNFDFSLDDLEAFIALQYARGVYGKGHPGPPLFAETMSRNKFKQVLHHLRFDVKST